MTQKRRFIPICFTTTCIWLVGTISRRAFCVIRMLLTTRRLNPLSNTGKLYNVFVYNVLLDFPFEHAISFLRGKWKSPRAYVLTAKWMPYLWTTKKLIYYLLFFSLFFFFERLCAISCCYYCYIMLLFSSFHKVHIAWSWVWKNFKCLVLICSEGI